LTIFNSRQQSSSYCTLLCKSQLLQLIIKLSFKSGMADTAFSPDGLDWITMLDFEASSWSNTGSFGISDAQDVQRYNPRSFEDTLQSLNAYA
jgi:hypothetical protein